MTNFYYKADNMQELALAIQHGISTQELRDLIDNLVAIYEPTEDMIENQEKLWPECVDTEYADIVAAARSLLFEIDAMEYPNEDHSYGPFPDHDWHPDGASIGWPNLVDSADKLREALGD